MKSGKPSYHVCNSRLRNKAAGREKMPAGEWAGTGYCKIPAGRGTDHVGTGRCKLHGGRSPRGQDSPHWVDGQHARHRYHLKPENVRTLYLKSRDDPEWLNLTDDAALLTTRIQLLLDELEGPPPDLRQLAGRLHDASTYLQENQPADASEQLRRALDMIDESLAYHRVWTEISDWVERRRRIVESGGKQLIQMQAMLKIDDIMELLRLVSDSVQQACDLFVTDPESRRNVVTHVSSKLLMAAGEQEKRAEADMAALATMEE